MPDHRDNIRVLEELYKTHHARMCKHALNLVGDMDAAKDIVQEVFIKVWKNMDQIEMGDYFTYYLLKATTSTSLNYLQKTRRFSEVQAEVKQQASPVKEEQDPAQLEELKQSIRTAIDRLPPKCKTVYLLCRQEDMSYKEVAAHMDITVKTVENQMGIALKRLREDLKDYVTLKAAALPVAIWAIWWIMNTLT